MINKDRTMDDNERTLTLIQNIMSDFTEVVKMLTETMSTQLNIIKEQENNNIEITRMHAQTMNRQLDIIESQNGFLKNIFDQIDANDKTLPQNIIELWHQKKKQI